MPRRTPFPPIPPGLRSSPPLNGRLEPRGEDCGRPVPRRPGDPELPRGRGRAHVAALILVPATSASAATPIVDWDRTPPMSGTVVHSTVRIESPLGGGTFPLAVLDHPPVDGAGYAIWGKVRYMGVQGAGYLEMWSVFPGGRYFSRTTDTEGP